jgi:hypothetical protein
MTLSTSEKVQVGGILLGLGGLIAGAILLEPIAIGAGVIGAGTAAVARLKSRRFVPPPHGTIVSNVPHADAISNQRTSDRQEENVPATANGQDGSQAA